MQWLRRSFIAGFFVTVPLVISVAALVWIFGIIDGFTRRWRAASWVGRSRGSASSSRCWWCWRSGRVATNVIGRRIVARGESG